MDSSHPKIQIDQIIRSRRRSIGLEISGNAHLIVRAPLLVSTRQINRIVIEKKIWILRKQQEARKRLAQISQKKYIPGEKFLFLGNEYPLILAQGQGIPFLYRENKFHITSESLSEARESFEVWYRKQAMEIFTDRISLYHRLSGIRCRQLTISNARKRWGSCSTRGNLYLNWRLIMAPLKVIDYVVVHELVHIRENNHSRAFWNRVEQLIPNYREQRNWLKHQGHLLNL
jgi:predicted metal-dependent hydrolase